MIKRILFILISVLTICSCEMTPQQGKVVFVSIAVDYNAPDGINALDNPPEDQRVLSSQIEALSYASGEIYEQYLFLEKNGIRYFNGAEKKWNHDDILYTLSELDTLQSDLVILHYSGHGDSTGALVTDADTSSRLSAERLLDAMRGIDGRKCLFLDSCFQITIVQRINPITRPFSLRIRLVSMNPQGIMVFHAISINSVISLL